MTDAADTPSPLAADPEHDSDIGCQLNHEHIAAAAQWAAEELALTGVARVHLTPGDMTVYDMLIVAPGPEWRSTGEHRGAEFWVALMGGIGHGYPWRGNPTVSASYASEKWTSGSTTWSGTVVALFLNATSRATAALATDTAGP